MQVKEFIKTLKSIYFWDKSKIYIYYDNCYGPSMINSQQIGDKYKSKKHDHLTIHSSGLQIKEGKERFMIFVNEGIDVNDEYYIKNNRLNKESNINNTQEQLEI